MPAAASAGKLRVYVGTYTEGTESQGIYRLELDLDAGVLSIAGQPTEAVNPSFLAFHPNGRFLYAVNETGDSWDAESGLVSAFAIDPVDGSLSLLNQRPSGGPSPCHISLDAEGRYALVANYWGGSVQVLPIAPDGTLGEPSAHVQHEGHSERQQRPHAHSADFGHSGRLAYVADLGLDEVRVYTFDSERGTLTPSDAPAASLAAGAGPRHFAQHPSGRYAYVINELNSTITVFDHDSQTGVLQERQTLTTLPEGYTRVNSTAEISIGQDGRFLYGSNRGHDSIAIFAIDQETGELTALGHEATRGKRPRHFAIDPSGRFLLAANQDSDSIAVFRIDPQSGMLEPIGEPLSLPRPVCLLMR